MHSLQGHRRVGHRRLKQSTPFYLSLVFGLIAAWLTVRNLAFKKKGECISVTYSRGGVCVCVGKDGVGGGGEVDVCN